ncbi:unnamed protein product [Paramecium sonneborni]|uniref:Tetratricopeptide repeat protein n=1 Tax=Paramecium sonneborni TaxID=65129 RepID=A0A8S1K9A9_9CILI|nr:unnamed protein product [Paramecium sonneborni]
MQDWPQCTYANHKTQSIIGFCFSSMCKNKNRLLCFDCFKENSHDNHKNEIIPIQELTEWMKLQENDSQKALDLLDQYIEMISKPILQIQKQVKNQIDYFSEQDLVNSNYTELDDKIKNLVRQKLIRNQICSDELKKWFIKFSQFLENLNKLMTQQNMTNTLFLKQFNQQFEDIINPKNQNNNNRNQQREGFLVGNFLQNEKNLQGQQNLNQNQDGLLEFQIQIDYLSQIYNQKKNERIDLLSDPTIYDGIDHLFYGQPDKAKQIFETLLKKQSDPDVVLWLAYSQYCLKKYKEVIATLKELLRNQENQQILQQGWYLILMSTISLQCYGDALISTYKYLKLRPHSHRGWIKAGFVLIKNNQLQLAISYLFQVLKYDVYNLEAKSYLCLAYYLTKQTQLAQQLYAEILNLDSKSTFLNFINPYIRR